MFSKKEINIFDFDIYARRISFFFNSKEKIGSLFGFVLTILYIVSSIILLLYYSLRTIRRFEVKTHDSTIYAQGIPSININPNLLYFAFGLEDPKSLNRYIDESIYYPVISFINKEKENGTLVTKDKITLNIERCKVEKFGSEYQNLFSEGELNNSYCLKDYNLTLAGGFKYNIFSYIRITISPCVNSTENNNHCKPQNVIDSQLSSSYFSMMIKDIGLNPLNYTVPIIPTLQNIYDTVDKSINRDFLIYFGITEIHTDIGLLTNKIKKEKYLQFRKFYTSFTFRDEIEYHQGKEIFVAQIRLEDIIHIQNRIYTKFSEVFSTIGGFMQLISNIFVLLTILTKNVYIEKKLLNSLFNFNINKQKIILSIKYAKKLNYLLYYEKEGFNSFIPIGAYKSQNPYIANQLNKSEVKNDFLYLKNNNNYSFSPLKKSRSGRFKNIKTKLKFNSEKDVDRFVKQIQKKNNNSFIYNNINKSKQALFKEEDSNNSQVNRINLRKNNKKGSNHFKELTTEMKLDEIGSLSNVDINIFDYFCRFGKIANKKADIELFISGVSFYRNQMNIINFFNIIFLTEIMLSKETNKNCNFINKIIEIPIKTGKI